MNTIGPFWLLLIKFLGAIIFLPRIVIGLVQSSFCTLNKSAEYHDANFRSFKIDNIQKRKLVYLLTSTRIFESSFTQGSDINKDDEFDYKRRLLDQWGVHYSSSQNNDINDEGHHLSSQLPTFPSTFASVSKAACHAINSSFYQQSRPDPNIVTNARSRSIFHYRPVRNVSRDSGRIGVEIDGARFLLSGRASANMDYVGIKHQEELALRRLSLLIGSQLSVDKPKIIEDQESLEKTRPIAIYFSTLSLALLASKELQYLKEQFQICNKNRGGESNLNQRQLNLFNDSMFEFQSNRNSSTKPESSSFPFDNIRICCLGEDDIPSEMVNSTKPRKKRKSRSSLEEGYIDPRNGIILIVQPSSTIGTDSFSPINQNKKGHKDETISRTPPIESLQKLAVRASLHEIPTILLSPRLESTIGGLSGSGAQVSYSSSLTSYSTLPGSRGRSRFVTANRRGGLDSSGYQHSETYGGSEPARPSPWLLRDYSPPVFAWVATWSQVTHRLPSETNLERDVSRYNGNKRTNSTTHTFLEKVGLFHSVMEKGHAWHLFALSKNYNTNRFHQELNDQSSNVQESYGEDKFCYMASTNPSSGRPTMGIIEAILSNYDSNGIKS